jgi:curli biogenesis system outer membrane secretion channel CsgG
MGQEVEASTAEQHLISDRCGEFSEEVSALLTGFGEEISQLTASALKTPQIVTKLNQVQEQIAQCKSTLAQTMRDVADKFRQNGDAYAQGNEASVQLVTHMLQAENFDYSYLR